MKDRRKSDGEHRDPEHKQHPANRARPCESASLSLSTITTTDVSCARQSKVRLPRPTTTRRSSSWTTGRLMVRSISSRSTTTERSSCSRTTVVRPLRSTSVWLVQRGISFFCSIPMTTCIPRRWKRAWSQFPDGYSRVFFRLGIVDGDGNRISNARVALTFMEFDGSAIAAVAEGTAFPSMPTSGNVFDAHQLKDILPIPEDEYRICADAFVLIKTAVSGPVRSIDRELGAYRIHGNNGYNAQSPQLLVDRKRLARHIDNYIKTANLIEQACIASGLPHRSYREASERAFYPLHMLCAGYANRVDSPHLSNLSRKSLTRSTARYLKSGDAVAPKRVPQALYLWSIVWMPQGASRVFDAIDGCMAATLAIGPVRDG